MLYKRKQSDAIMHNTRNLHRRRASYFLVMSGKNLLEGFVAHHRALL